MPAKRFLTFAVCICLSACTCLRPITCLAQITATDLPSSPQQDKASLSGEVTDESGSLVPGALVVVSSGERTVMETADSNGEFHAYGLPAGEYTMRVVAAGFQVSLLNGSLDADEQKLLEPVELKMNGGKANVTVYATQHDIATAQVAAEEKQRVFGIVPNFYVVYFPNPAPLSAAQKFHLAWRSTFDPISFLGVGISAGIEQVSDDFKGFGQDHKGYFQRYGTGFADSTVSAFLGGALLPVIFHQDPRYYYQGTGSTRSRALHAISSVVICRGDNGKREFNFSNILGNFASAGISNIYYPASDRNGAGLTLQNAAVGTAFGAFAALMQEFVVPHFTPHRPGKTVTPAQAAGGF